MQYNSPIGYELTPLNLKKGSNKVKFKIKNISDTSLQDVELALYSVDNGAIEINDSTQNIGELKPDEMKETTIKVTAYLPTEVYARITMLKNKVPIRWESPIIYLTVPDTHIPRDEQSSG